MRLPFLRPKPAAPVASEADIARERRRARQRLTGAAVLVVAGVVGLSLLFESRPRPLPVDTPMLLAQRGEAPALPPVPAALPPAPAAVLPAPAPAAPAPAAPVVEPAPSQPAPAAAPPIEKPGEKPGDRPVDKPVANVPEKPAEKVAAKPAEPPAKPAAAGVARSDDGARARALLEGAAAAPATGARFVVQAGAYSEANALRDARQRIERLGLKTYTQVVDADGSKRTRVRVGPFSTRDEAEAAAAKVRAAGLPVTVLTL